MIADESVERTGDVIVYDLRDADAWEEACKDRELWGRSRSEVHGLGTDHIAIQFLPSTLEASA